MMHFHIITLFPEACTCYLGESILGRAEKDGTIKIDFYNPRDFTNERKARVDKKPYGGGPGMVLEALPVIRAIEKAKGKKKKVKIVFFSPSGKQFTNAQAQNISHTYRHVIFVCGRYEGIDARVKRVFPMDDVSIGPYVLTGGELPALVMIDAISRQIEGVLGDSSSREEQRTSSSEVYTRPESFRHKRKNYTVPEVLLSGDHKKIEDWKKGSEKKDL